MKKILKHESSLNGEQMMKKQTKTLEYQTPNISLDMQ